MSTELLFEAGLKHQKKGSFKDAKDSYQKVLQQDPGNFAALNNLGVVDLALGDLEGSLACFEKVVIHDRHDSDAFFNMGVVLFQLKRLVQALKAFKMAEKYRQGDYLITKNLGLTHLELNQIPEAILNFKHLLKIREDDWEANYQLAKCSFLQKDFEAALKSAEQARELNKTGKPVLLLLADILEQLHKIGEVEQVLSVLYDIYPNDQEIFARLVNFHLSNGLVDRARRVTEGFLITNPYSFVGNRLLREINHKTEKTVSEKKEDEKPTQGNGELKFNLNQLEQEYRDFVSRKDFENGIARFKQYVSSFGSHPEVIERLAQLLQSADRLEEALEAYDSISQQVDRVQIERGRLLFELKKYSQARAVFTEIADVDSKSGLAYMYLGMIALEEGKDEDAASFLERAVNCGTDFQEPALLLGQIYYKHGDSSRAREMFSRVIRFYPDERKALYHLGLINYQENILEKSVKYFRRYLELVPDDYQVLDLMGKIYLKQKKIRNARGVWQKLAEISPRNVEEILLKSRAYLFLEEQESAQRELRIAERVDNYHWGVHYYLGLYFLIVNDLTESLKSFFRSWQLNQLEFTRESNFISQYFNREKLEILVSAFEDDNSDISRDIAAFFRTLFTRH
ncbi:MAG: tetratricopeptide repeat protein [Candidatus Wallbacteria bacterium]|nr:tetratricopeptide repeat protein [Candidatus Wallbacteria bacterium]